MIIFIQNSARISIFALLWCDTDVRSCTCFVLFWLVAVCSHELYDDDDDVDERLSADLHDTDARRQVQAEVHAASRWATGENVRAGVIKRCVHMVIHWRQTGMMWFQVYALRPIAKFLCDTVLSWCHQICAFSKCKCKTNETQRGFDDWYMYKNHNNIRTACPSSRARPILQLLLIDGWRHTLEWQPRIVLTDRQAGLSRTCRHWSAHW